MATKAELLEKAIGLGVEGLDDSSSVKEIKEAIAAKQEEDGAGAGGTKKTVDEAPEGFVKVELTQNCKIGDAYCNAGETVTVTAAERDALVSKGLAKGGEDAR